MSILERMPGGTPVLRACSALALLLAGVAGLWQPANAYAFDLSSVTLSVPESAHTGGAFAFSATVSIPPGEHLTVKSIDLYIYRVDNAGQSARTRADDPAHLITCAGLPLSTGNTVYRSARIAGGDVEIYASAGDTWRYREDVPSPIALPSFSGYGPGPASIRYDVIWYVPLTMEWLTGPHQVDFEVTRIDTATRDRNTRTYTRTAAFWVNFPPRPGTTYVAQYVDGAGRFNQNVTVASTDGSARAVVGRGTRGLLSRQPLGEITIIPAIMPSTPPSHGTFVDRAFTFLPEKATFDPPITVSIPYDPSLLSAGVSDRSLAIAVLNPETGGWDTLVSTVDAANRRVMALVDHFSVFRIVASTNPAAFAVSNLSVTQAVDIDKPVTIGVVVTNSGDLSGAYDVTVKSDNATIASKSVTVPGRSSQKVTFTTSRSGPGYYAVDVNGLTDTFLVRPAPEPPSRPAPSPAPPSPTPTSPPTQTTILLSETTQVVLTAPRSDLWLAGIIASGILLALAAWQLARNLRGD